MTTRLAGTFACLAALAITLIHTFVFKVTGQDFLASPISELSRGAFGGLHSFGLGWFAAGHVALAIALQKMGSGRLWRFGQLLLVAAALILAYVAVYFSTASDNVLYGDNANDPLSILASVIGVAMAAFQSGLGRRSRHLATFNGACFIVWLLLIPLILLVNSTWLGAYERIVAITYVIWLFGLAAAAAKSPT